MNDSRDPRIQPGYKLLRHDEKQLALLGAILDALLATQPKVELPISSIRPATPRKTKA